MNLCDSFFCCVGTIQKDKRMNLDIYKCDRILLESINFINELREQKQDATYNLISLIGISELQKNCNIF